MRAASEVLLRDLRHPPALEDLARQVGTHEKRLSRVFRDHLGQTVFEYLRDTRLRAAMHFLAETSMGIGDIAEEIGFSTPGNFATAFRERFGITPSDWRRQRHAVNARPPHPARTITMGKRHAAWAAGCRAVLLLLLAMAVTCATARARRRRTRATGRRVGLRDASTTMSAAQVAARLADPAHGTPVAGTSSFNVEFSRSAWWIRATLTNRDSAARPLVLVIRDARVDQAGLLSRPERRVDTRQPLPGGRRR